MRSGVRFTVSPKDVLEDAAAFLASDPVRHNVILTVLEGSGTVSGADGERAVRAGEVIAYEPDEPHGMKALGERLVLLAAIVPRPGTR